MYLTACMFSFAQKARLWAAFLAMKGEPTCFMLYRSIIKQRSTNMDSTSTSEIVLSLTLKEQPTQSPIIERPYTYEDAFSDALGQDYTSYSSHGRYAGSPDFRNNTLFLWESGCRTNGTWNCTLACSDSEQGRNMVWNSSEAMFTLQNCLVYPMLLNATAHGWLVEDPPGLLDKFNIIPDDIKTNYTTDFAPSSRVRPVIDRCLAASCASLPHYGRCVLDDDGNSSHNPWIDRSAYLIGPVDQKWRPSVVSIAFKSHHLFTFHRR